MNDEKRREQKRIRNRRHRERLQEFIEEYGPVRASLFPSEKEIREEEREPRVFHDFRDGRLECGGGYRQAFIN